MTNTVADETRRYASFVIRNNRLLGGKTMEIAHEQSGEQVSVASLSEAVGWIRSQVGTELAAAVPGHDLAHLGGSFAVESGA